MKKRYYLFYLAMALLVTACTPEEADLFDDSSANRADAAIETTIDLLTSASNGWLMEYYPESMQKYGGYNLIFSFDKEGVVKVAGEGSDPTDIASSLYKVKQSAGIVLSFDTYNPIFHLFSDPSDPTGVGGTGYGLEGDYDFLVLEASAEKIILKGKKSGGYATMTPMVMGEWSEFLTGIEEAEEAMTFDKIKLELNGERIHISISYRTFTFTYVEEGETNSQTVAYIVTSTGYKFYNPITIKGVTLHGFTFDAENEWFTESENAPAKIIPVPPSLNDLFVAGNWFIAYSTLGKYAQPKFDICKKNLDAYNFTLYYAFIGPSSNNTYGLHVNVSGYTGYLGLGYTLILDEQISMGFNVKADNNGAWFYNNTGFSNMLDPFGHSSERTFTLTADDLTEPTYITLTEDSNPDNVITLHKAQIFFPFDR